MKRLFSMSALVVATALFFASCGGNEAVQTEDAPEVNSEEAVVTPEVEPVAEEVPEAEIAVFDIEAGKAIYDTKCMACHMTGAAGAAKLDDLAAWEASAAKGLETLYKNSIEGFTGEKGVMPPKGGFVDLTDEDMHNAIAYMMQTAGVEAN